MLRLIIADDEKNIRETICSVIDWKSLNIEVVGIYKNGLEAYDAILDEYPDIVLTDIRMPKLSGLELIQKITQTHDNIQFIILSGYSEFSYAKEAMKYGVKHFILKPCNEQEIINAVQEASAEHYRKLSYLLAEKKLQTFRTQLNKSLMRDILIQALSSEGHICDLPETYESYLDFHQTSYKLCYLYYLEEHLVEPCIDQIQDFIHTLAPEIAVTFIYVKNTLTFFFLNVKSDYSQLVAFFEHLHIQGQNITCIFQHQTYLCLLELLQVLIPKVQRYENIYLYSGIHSTAICNYNSLFQKVSQLSDALLAETNEEKHHNLTEELKTLLLSVKNTELLRSLISNLLLRPIKLSMAYTPSDIAEILSFISTVSSNAEICDIFFHKLDIIYPLPQFHTAKYKPFIEEILNYTNEHLSDPNLTLKWIAENHLYMNVDYISRQFVLQTGIKFSAYLNNLRITRAKQLLINCDSEKIYHVAEQVGCGNNPQYFSHLFKKYTKMTPREYIQKMKEPSALVGSISRT